MTLRKQIIEKHIHATYGKSSMPSSLIHFLDREWDSIINKRGRDAEDNLTNEIWMWFSVSETARKVASLILDEVRILPPTEAQLVQTVKDAWNDAGPFPPLHRDMQRTLRQQWPVLAEAVENLASR